LTTDHSLHLDAQGHTSRKPETEDPQDHDHHHPHVHRLPRAKGNTNFLIFK